MYRLVYVGVFMALALAVTAMLPLLLLMLGIYAIGMLMALFL